MSGGTNVRGRCGASFPNHELKNSEMMAGENELFIGLNFDAVTVRSSATFYGLILFVMAGVTC
jgi:hypothetical protein